MTTTASDKKWYVVRAVSGQEAKIKDYIMSEISRFGYDHLVEDILVPTEKVIQIRNGKKINKERVYFPGYIMVKANLTKRTSESVIKTSNSTWVFSMYFTNFKPKKPITPPKTIPPITS